MKKIALKKLHLLFFIIIYGFPFCTKGQNDIVLTTAKDEYCTYITPTFLNVVQLLFASESSYKFELESLDYIKTATGNINEYMAKLSVRKAHFRIISKNDRRLFMSYSPNNVDLVTTFRNSIKGIIKDLLVSHEGDYEVYKLIIPYDGLKYKVTFRLNSVVDKEYIMGRPVTIDGGYLSATID